MTQLALHVCEGQIARRWLAAVAVGAFVFLLAATAPHWVHHASEAADHASVACKLYTLAVSAQWLALAALPPLVYWLTQQLVRLGHECLADFWIRPLLRGRSPPPSLP